MIQSLYKIFLYLKRFFERITIVPIQLEYHYDDDRVEFFIRSVRDAFTTGQVIVKPCELSRKNGGRLPDAKGFGKTKVMMLMSNKSLRGTAGRLERVPQRNGIWRVYKATSGSATTVCELCVDQLKETFRTIPTVINLSFYSDNMD